MDIDFFIAVLPNIATVLLAACYVPQIVHNYRTKNVENASTLFWVLLIAALSLFFTYNVLLFIKFGVYMGIITQAANLILATTVFTQIMIYRKK
ncbi:PQ-loop repeat-containing protein [Cytobacillus horneckiae]|uniref:PQ-loop domain-containing transporter n=1 Tax=Cytobacillus horneckiae TaxID=549687 RepID=UPI0034CD722C